MTIQEAEELARTEPYQFQWWALGKVGARVHERKKGADRGIDGKLVFADGTSRGFREIIISVKAGKLSPSHVRDLRGVVDREKAAIGVLLSCEEPSRDMRREAASAGFFDSAWGSHPRLQLLTIAEQLDGRGIDYPRASGVNQTFRQAPKAKRRGAPAPELFDGIPVPLSEPCSAERARTSKD